MLTLVTDEHVEIALFVLNKLYHTETWMRSKGKSERLTQILSLQERKQGNDAPRHLIANEEQSI